MFWRGIKRLGGPFCLLVRRAALSSGLVPFLACGGGGFNGLEPPVQLKQGTYRQLKVDHDFKRRLSRSRYVRLKLLNQGEAPAVFYLVFEDDKSEDYWSRLNFKTTLVPGENEVVFDLERSVGERGSVRERKLSFDRLKKAWFVFNPDGGQSADGGQRKNGPVSLRSARLERAEEPSVPKGTYFFDFAGEEMPSAAFKGAKIAKKTSEYSAEKGWGFKKVELWKERDARIAPKHLSSSLSVEKALFRIDLPPGRYRYQLVWDELGYWDAPFWKDRTLYVNGSPALKESRSSMKDFLKDYLGFMQEPAPRSHAYDFYLKKAFRPARGEAASRKGGIEFKVEGDPTGASLNTLMLWPVSKDKEMAEFREKLDSFSRKAFEIKYRKIKNKSFAVKKLKASVAKGSVFRADAPCGKDKKNREVFAKNGRPSFDICLSAPPGEVTFEFKGFKSLSDEKLENVFKTALYRYRPKSIDLNHETYEIRADELDPLPGKSFAMNGYPVRYLNISLADNALEGGLPAGTHGGSIRFELKQEGKTLKARIPVSFVVLESEYDRLPVDAGFIGLSPLPSLWFEAEDKSEYAAAYRLKAFSKLREAGFALNTEVQAPKLRYQDAKKSRFELESEGLGDFVGKDQNEVFMYNTGFPQELFTGKLRNAGQSEDEYFKNLREQLSKTLKKNPGKSFVWLYSDEAAGHRNAVETDLKRLERYRKLFPHFRYGGFGTPQAWDGAKKLYQSWDYGFYSDIPRSGWLSKLEKQGQKTGVYNLCAEPSADLKCCFGPVLYFMGHAGIARYLEWHAAAIHNYPGFDLDGRESDIALFYPGPNKGITVTKRFKDAASGLQTAKKLYLLEGYLASRKAPGLKELKAKRWLKRLRRRNIFPLKSFIKDYCSGAAYHQDLQALDKYLTELI